MNLLRASATIGGLTLVSRILGFARDQLFANLVGAGMAADCFVAAFRLPNLFRALFAEGAFSAAFVPMFARASQENPRAGQRLAEDVLAVMVPALLLFTSLMMLIAPAVVWLMAAGNTQESARFALAVEFTRLTFPYLLFISLVALLGGVLNSLGRFAAAASAPILLNLTLIIGLLFFHGQTPVESARTQSVAVAVAGIVQFVWLLWAVHRAGHGLKLRLPRWTHNVRQLLSRAGPAALGAGATQINLFISTTLSFGVLGEGAASWLYYADRLNQLPLGLIGIGVGTALLPTLSRLLAENRETDAAHSQNRAMELALFFALPAALALSVAAQPLIAGLLQHGAFTADDTRRTAQVLAAFSLGLPAYILIKILVPGFHARGDTATPTRIGFVTIAVNLVGNLAAVYLTPLGATGIALATAVAAWTNALLLYWLLRKRGWFQADARLKRTALRLLLPNGLMVAALWLVMRLNTDFTGPLPIRLLWLGLLVGAALLVYFTSAIGLRALPLADLKRALKR